MTCSLQKMELLDMSGQDAIKMSIVLFYPLRAKKILLETLFLT